VASDPFPGVFGQSDLEAAITPITSTASAEICRPKELIRNFLLPLPKAPFPAA
jgi:hypothetical protein